MRNTFILFTIVCLTFASSSDLYAQDSLRVSKLSQIYDYWFDARDVAIEGNYAYVMTNVSGLRILDISNPEQPLEVGYINSGGWGRSVVVNENIVYFLKVHGLLGDYQALQIVDVEDPANPEVLSYYNLPRGATALAYQDGFLFIEDGVEYDQAQGYFNRTTLILDVSDPTYPEEAGRLVQDEGYPSIDIAVSGDFLYKARVTEGIEIVDVADPENPELLTTYDPGGNVRGVTAIGDYLFATNGRDGLVILDISDPRSEITEVGFVDEMENAVDVAVSGNYAYVADADRDPLGGWVRVVDIESPDNPVIVGVVPVSSPERIAVSGNQVYVATLSDGMQVFDISDPENPANMGEYDSDGAVHKVTMSGDYAYVSDDSLGMRIVDISDPANPEEIGSYDTPGSTRNIFLEDTLAYIADGGSGLRIVDVSDPAEPDEIGFIEVEGYCSNVAVDGGYAYVTIGQPYREPFEQVISGMYAIDVSDPASPEMMSFYDAVRSVNGIAISDNYAFLTVFSWGLVVLDISDPDNLEEVAFLEEEDGANNSIYISGNYAFIADAELLTIVDISDPTDPEVVSYWGEAWSTDVTVQGDYAFIADSEGLKILDVSDPTQPSIAGGYDTPGYAWGVAVNGNIVCVADLTNLGVYNCSAVLGINDKPKPVPMDFKLLSVYPNPFNPNTSIAIAMPERSFLSINVINIFGQQVAELVTGRYSPGYHEFSFDGAGLSSGIYFIHANVPGKMDEVRKIVLMR